jgi:alpha-amylase
VGLAVIPAALALRVGDTGVLTAALVDAAGAVVEVPTGPLPWASSNASVVTLSGTGTVTAIAAGEATVSTTSGGFSGSARVIVTR